MKHGLIIRRIPSVYLILCLINTILLLGGILLDIRMFILVGLFVQYVATFYMFIKERAYFTIAFLISFFTFLLGRIFINGISREASLLTGAFIYDGGPTDKELALTLSLLFFSMILMSFGVLMTPSKERVYEKENSMDIKMEQLEKVNTILFYVTAVFAIAVAFERFLFLFIGESYTSYYTSFARSLPSFIYKIAELNTPAFFAVLALAPKKRKLKPIMMVFLLIRFFVLLGGQRNLFIRALLICFSYFLLRNHWDSEEKWLTKTQLRVVLCAVPILIVALQGWGAIRNGVSFGFEGIGKSIENFFKDQGSTSVVIYKGIELGDKLPKHTNYTFAPIMNFWINNRITKIFYQAASYGQQTTELALYGNNFGAALTYAYIPYNYTIGIGMGSSYIIEVFHDFGWIGVIVINLVYGTILKRLDIFFKVRNSAPWKGMILLLLADGIIYAPRDSALAFITNGANFTVILYIFLVLALVSMMFNRK